MMFSARTFSCFLIFSLLLSWSLVQAQSVSEEEALAKTYLQKQEYDKASSIYSKLANNNQQFNTIYPDYLKTLLALKNYKEAEKLVKKAIKKNPEVPAFTIDLGVVQLAGGDKKGSEKVFDKAITQVNSNTVIPVAQAFEQNRLYDYAEKTYLQGRKINKKETDFTSQLMQLYAYQRQSEKLITEILNIVKENPEQLLLAQNMLQNSLREEKEFEALEKILLTHVQQSPDKNVYSELLIWVYTQRKDFFSALIQAKSLDKRTKGGGEKVMELGAISLKNKDYESAIDAYNYVIKEYRSSPYYGYARERLIKAREEQVRNTFPVDLDKIRTLIADYQNLLNEVGKSGRTVEVMKNMATLHAFYLDEKDKAIALLQEVINTPRANPDLVAEAKISLGDIYLLQGEPWEATLLYSQVEKSHKETAIGHEAKLRNAKLNYYKGDFQLAQEHLDILKLATSREIANDAMDLSLLITDNIGLDSSTAALKEYAATELLIFQNKLPEAQEQLNTILQKYPQHSLTDDIFYLKAKVFLKTGNFQEAIQNLTKITDNPQYDILSDDALYLLATIYEEQVKDPEKAKLLYNDLIVKYPGSIYTVDARKRFRKLRGDVVN
ncbi:tetratricopeptide repeat protein [Adhaeribacter swui]|uniref:Tetratricopeptide repeat protein n=1 Tax=Adhaeribacter swui TaxID=2086471 RepID=A0A7G7G5X9_9BACT|nr:tetratricopeptide repeat protein [Adhaeribacter swui]QNF32563.1 tetratricopeptide repeat protein [Adhaeribacter swui]